jgi:hypothetical protein
MGNGRYSFKGSGYVRGGILTASSWQELEACGSGQGPRARRSAAPAHPASRDRLFALPSETVRPGSLGSWLQRAVARLKRRSLSSTCAPPPRDT